MTQTNALRRFDPPGVSNVLPDALAETCEAVRIHFSDLIDGELEAALCAQLERHLRECEECRVYIESVKRTIRLYRERDLLHMPEAARARLWSHLKLDTIQSACLSRPNGVNE